MCKDRFKELRDSQSVTSCCFVLGALCCRWGQVPPSSLDSHVRSYISRLTSSDTRRKKINKWSSRGWKWKWEKQVAFSPRSTSCHSQWASSVYESTKHRIISKHECVIYNTALQPHHAPNKNTQSHVITAVSLMGGSWLSHTRCPQKPVYFFWSLPDIVLFFSSLHVWAVPEHPLVLSACVYPCGQTCNFIKGAMERTVCHEGPGSTVPHCLRGWMSHGRQIRFGGIWDGLSAIALGQQC